MNQTTDLPIEPRRRIMPEEPAMISSLRGTLSEDARKVLVILKLTHGSTRPDLELILTDSDGLEISRAFIIENYGENLEFTLHIRQEKVKFPLTLKCGLSYLDDEVFSEKAVQIERSEMVIPK